MKLIQIFTFAFIVVSASIGASAQVENIPISRIAERYVKLVLAIGEHEPGYVDAYYGPKNWQNEVRADKPSLTNLKTEAITLSAALKPHGETTKPGIAKQRLHFLAKQLIAVHTRISILQGQKFSFDEETRLLFDAVVPEIKKSDLDTALTKLDTLVGGDGSLQERFVAYRAQFTIPKDKLRAVFAAAINACKTRTEKFIPLPEGESFTSEFVTDKAWSGYNWYQGAAKSLIQVNTDFPSFIDSAVNLGCHEGYPGHHVFNAMLESNLVNKRGWIEFSVYPLYSPQSLLAEGTASYARFMAFPGDSQSEFEATKLFPLAGMDAGKKGEKAKQYFDTLKAIADLRYARVEGARRYIDGKLSRDELVDWLARYQLISRERAEQGVRFIEKYRGYVINYTLGSDLTAAYVARYGGTGHKQRWSAYETLLSTPLTASMLVN